MKDRKFSPERLMKIRRLRKARRLFKQCSLFAYQTMKQDYPDYTYEQFWDDLRRRTKKKRKKSKTPLTRYGRYLRIQELTGKYLSTKDPQYLLQANVLRKRITQPYRLLVRFSGTATEYFFSALIPIERIEQLTANVNTCQTEEQAQKLIERFRENQHIL